MRSSKFFDLLRTLDRKEIQEFDQYLQVFHKRKKIAIRVYTYIKKFAHNLDDDKLERERAYSEIFKEEKVFNYRKIMDSLSDLSILLREFLLCKEVQHNSKTRDILQIDLLKKRQLEKEIELHLKDYFRDSDNGQITSMWDYWYQLKLYDAYYFSTNTDKFSATKAIKEVMVNLDRFWISSKLKYACELMSRANILDEEHVIPLLNEAITYYRKNQQDFAEVVEIYALALQMINLNEEKYFRQTQLLLDNHLSKMNSQDRLIILSYLINFAASMIKNAKIEYTQILLNLYRYGVDKKILIVDGFIAPTRFINIVETACFLKEMEWVEEFIKDYKIYLESPTKINTLIIANARINFELSKFDIAMKLLNQVEFKNIYLKIRGKELLIRSFIELEEDQNLVLDLCRAFEAQLKRDTLLSGEIIEACLNFVKIVRSFILKNKTKTQLLNQIESAKLIHLKSWLKEKVNKLK